MSCNRSFLKRPFCIHEGFCVSAFIENIIEPAEDKKVIFPTLWGHFLLFCEREGVMRWMRYKPDDFWDDLCDKIAGQNLPYEAVTTKSQKRLLRGCRCRYSTAMEPEVGLLEKYPHVFIRRTSW